MPLPINNDSDVEIVVWIYERNVFLVKIANENSKAGEVNI